jgi:hypothetical protein
MQNKCYIQDQIEINSKIIKFMELIINLADCKYGTIDHN